MRRKALLVLELKDLIKELGLKFADLINLPTTVPSEIEKVLVSGGPTATVADWQPRV